MNWFEKFLYYMQAKMNTPEPFGWFHVLWILLTFIALFSLYKIKNKHNDKQLKWVLAIYGIIAFLLELTKQLIWSFNYDPITSLITWNYEWYAAPFQLCTTPMYISLICLFLKKNKFRDALLSYVAFFTILGGLTTILMPSSCFTSYIEINIHTMYLHCGSLVVSIYLLFSKEIKLNFSNFFYGYIVFLVLTFIANTLNICFYQFGFIGDETFNMFYISPYFISSLPIYNIIQESVPYILYLFIYLVSIYLGGTIIYVIAYLIDIFANKNKELK